MNYDFIQTLLISLVFLAVLVEIKTGGTGLGALLGIIAAALFWGSSYMAGQASIYLICIFTVGIILILIEILTPSVGIFAILGFIAIFYSFIQAIGGDISAVYMLFISLIIAILIFVLILKFLPESKLWRKLVLDKTSSSTAGYVSTVDNSIYLHKTGIVSTELRPAGTVVIDSQPVDVVSEGAFIPKGSRVQVVHVEGMRIVVRKLQ